MGVMNFVCAHRKRGFAAYRVVGDVHHRGTEALRDQMPTLGCNCGFKKFEVDKTLYQQLLKDEVLHDLVL